MQSKNGGCFMNLTNIISDIPILIVIIVFMQQIKELVMSLLAIFGD